MRHAEPAREVDGARLSLLPDQVVDQLDVILGKLGLVARAGVDEPAGGNVGADGAGAIGHAEDSPIPSSDRRV